MTNYDGIDSRYNYGFYQQFLMTNYVSISSLITMV